MTSSGEDAKLAARLARLSPAARAKVLRALGRTAEASTRVVPVDRSRPLPLSYAQERLWFLDRLMSGSAAYNMPAVLRVEGALDVDALRAALGDLVRRHEVLRTSLVEGPDGPLQTIEETTEVPFVLEGVEDEESARARARELASAPFDLSVAPLLRCGVFRLGAADHVLVFVVHHVASDGWSMPILVREWSEFYASRVEGRSPRLPALPVQYVDYAVWQRKWLEAGELERQLGYWREQLNGVAPVLELPLDRPRPKMKADRGKIVPVELAPNLMRGVEAFAREVGATEFMVLLAAWQLLLARYARTDDVVVGSPIAGRGTAEVEGLIGFFVNTLALRTDVSGDPSFRALVERVKAVTLGAYAHQDVPFEKLVRELGVERDTSVTPVFQVMFVHQTSTQVASDGAAQELVKGLRLRPWEEGAESSAQFDLTLTLSASGTGGLSYDASLFDAATAEQLASQLGVLLDGCLAAVDSPVSSISLLTAKARARVLGWSGRKTAAPPELPHERIAGYGKREATRLAALHGDAQLTFGELELRSRRVGQELRRRGYGPESRVGVCLDRGFELLSAMFGVFRAGATYVPLEPTYPRERLQHILQDSGCELVLTEAALWSSLQIDSDVDLELASGFGAEGAVDEALPPVAWDTGAYVIYTSGSSGRPKGALVEHRSLANLAERQAELFQTVGGDRVLQFAPIAFDGAIGEIVWALSKGNALVFPTKREELSGAGLEDLIRRHAVTVALMPPSVQATLASADSLRVLVSAGEAAQADQVRRWAAGTRYINGYGPTENTVATSAHVCRDGDGDRGARIPLGPPFANVQAYVVDGEGELLPEHVPGELWVGGVQVVRGYVNRPALTAERFVPNAWEGSGARCYRTGDLVRWLPDGELDFLGRIDQQVKLRGLRIELGEIEAAVASLPSVSQAVVAVRRGPGGSEHLVAYLIRAQRHPSASTFEAELKNGLPDYMVPRIWVDLDTLPLTPNGKLDRRALPEPEWVSAVAYEAPATPTEQVLAELWQGLLGMERVGRRDDFFSLGGHSLLATRLVAQVRSRLGVELPLRDVFTNPELGALAAAVSELDAEGAVPPLEASERSGPLPLSYAQERLWFLDRLMPASAAYHIPAVLRVEGALDVAALRGALSDLVQRHEVLRTSLVEGSEGPVQVVAETAEVPFFLEDAADEGSARARAEELVGLPFDLGVAPLLRCGVLRLGPADQVLVLVMHHVVSDGWSAGVLIREWSELYASRVEAREPRLRDLPVQYADYALWQRKWMEDEGELERQLSYWRNQLSGAPPALDLPLDHARPRVKGVRGGSVPVALPEGAMASIEALARDAGATEFMVLLAAWQLLLSRYSNASDVVVGTPIAGRRMSEVEGLIGCFMNTLALRTDVSGDPSFREVVDRVKEVTLGAYAHQDVPFEKVVSELVLERNTSVTPLFQVMFIYHAAGEASQGPGASVAPPSLRLTNLGARSNVEKFDLTLSMSPSGHGELAYDAALFDVETAREISQAFTSSLNVLTKTPLAPLSQLDTTAPAAVHDQLVEWNATAEEGGGPRETVVDLVESHVRADPSRPAIEWGESSWSYGELWARSSVVEAAVASRGELPGGRVAVYLDRGGQLLGAMLGIWRAGCAYIPLDPGFPRERLSYIIADSGCRHAVTTRLVWARSPLVGVEPIFVEELSDLGPGSSEPGFLAYMIYTSGSTGHPKGVAVPHEGVASFLRTMSRRPGVAAGDVLVAVTTPSFDISVLELWLPLVCGARVVVADSEQAHDASQLRSLLTKRGATLMQATPATWRMLLDDGWRADGFKVLCGGESLPKELARALCESGAELWNMYGPTETTIWSSCGRVRLEDERVSIGRPIGNTQFYVLDENMSLLPRGGVGMLWIGGVGVTSGYRGRARLTAERYVPNPHGEGRIYCTGDLGRWLRDGTLECLGRIDGQVKVRGYRIELGEIEAVLERDPRVGQAAVRVWGKGLEGRLVAYLVLEEGEEPEQQTLDSIRTELSRVLPDYMVPSSTVVLPELPLTPNAKVDRRSLPEPSAGGSDAAYESPSNDVEEVLARIWQDLLGAERVGRNDHFFARGGHSLLAMRLVSQVRGQLGVELSLRTVFEHSELASLARAVAALEVSGAVPSVEPVDRAGPLPLSYAQERLWFLDRLMSGSAVYHMPAVLRVEGALDVDGLRGALRDLVQRHEVLRTSLVEGPDGPMQVVADTAEVPFVFEDVGDIETARLRASELVSAPFDLSAAPLLRCAVLRLGPAEHVLVFVMHHIVSDGWSIPILVREWSELYSARVEGREARLPALPVQYADYAVWQRNWMEGGELERQLDYWRERLSAAPPVLELPLDRPRPKVKGERGGSVPVELSSQAMTSVAALARQVGGTPFMVLLAAWQLLLSRYARTDDVVVGTPIAGRRTSEVEGLIGFFVNTLALRTDLSGAPTFRELVKRVKEVTLGAYAHQDVPFEKLVGELDIQRDMSVTPVFQAMFVFQTESEQRGTQGGRLGGLAMKSLGLGSAGDAKYDVTLSLMPSGVGSIQYDVSLFEEATVERMARGLSRLVTRCVAAPDATCVQLSEPDGSERDRLLEWASGAPPSTDGTIASEFEAQVDRDPNALALLDGTRQLTYAQLDALANRVAHALRRRGVGPEDVVGVLVERSINYVVALLGALKAGSAYLPIDPEYPASRIQYLVEDGACSALLTTSELLISLDEIVALEVVLLDPDSDLWRESEDRGPSVVQPWNAAYVLYTSGTTGRPKGVVVSHGAIVNQVRGACERYALEPDSRTFLGLSLAFDALLNCFLAPLCMGASVVIPKQDELAGDGMAAQIAASGVSWVSAPWPILSLLPSATIRRLRTLVTGGQAPAQEFAGLSRHVRSAWNEYGPTENTVCSTAYRCVGGETRIPIGRPLAGVRAYVLTDAVRLSPVGGVGELFLGGVQVARGYGGRARQTASLFVPDVYGEPGSRMYRTGDLVRWGLEGQLDFLGRGDAQVKLNGRRVELGEIEAAIEALPGVRAATAAVQRSDSGVERLIGYVVTAEPWDPGRVEAQLAQQLPRFMVPRTWVSLPSLPLTPHGKVDPTALPTPAWEGAGAQDPPETPTEKALSEIWCELLGVEQVGRSDDFFALGGHSLLATRLVSQVRSRLGVDLPLERVFESPKLREVATFLDTSVGEPSWQGVSRLNGTVDGPVILFSYLATGFSRVFLPMGRHLSEYTCLGLTHPALSGVKREFISVAELAVWHVDQLLSSDRPTVPSMVVGYSAGGRLAFEVAREFRRRCPGAGTSVALIDSLWRDMGVEPSVFEYATMVNGGPPPGLPHDVTLEGLREWLRDHGAREADLRELEPGYRVWFGMRRCIQMESSKQAARAESASTPTLLMVAREREELPAGIPSRDQWVEGLEAARACQVTDWRAAAGDGLEVIELAMNHTFAGTEQGMSLIAPLLRARLAAASTPPER